MKHSSRVRRAKKQARSELGPDDWHRFNYAKFKFNNFTDNCARTTLDNFVVSQVPQVISNATLGWPANSNWTMQSLMKSYSQEKFKVGEDNKGKSVYMSLSAFNYYLCDPRGAAIDDSPLYIFDSQFSSRTATHSARSQPYTGKKASKAACHILQDYTVPACFQNDLFRLTTHRRPPFRWFVCGPARSGTGIHVDPLGTNAWNALVSGRKRWALFPPSTPKHLIYPRVKDHEAATWFAQVYPTITALPRDEREKLGMVEIDQVRGETVHVPSGWHHVVINVEFSVAITHNFCLPTTFEETWLRTRYSRPRLAKKLYGKLRDSKSKLLKGDVNSRGIDKYERKNRRRLARLTRGLETVPKLFESSSSSSSSSTSQGESDDAKELVVCKCCNATVGSKII